MDGVKGEAKGGKEGEERTICTVVYTLTEPMETVGLC